MSAGMQGSSARSGGCFLTVFILLGFLYGLSIQNPRMTARDAHLLCARLQNGQSVEQAKRDYAEVAQGDARVADVFVTTVMSIYPSCP